MNNALPGFLLALLLFWPLQGWTAEAEEIRFRPGEVADTVRGTVTDTIKTWQFRARKDQQVAVTLEPAGGDRGMLTMTLYAYCGEEFGAPLAIDVLQWQGKLPCSDRYTLDVAPAADAMKQKRVQGYALTLTIR